MDQILEPLLEFTYSPVSYWTVGSVKAAPLLSPDAQWSWLTVLGESVWSVEKEAGGRTGIKGAGDVCMREKFSFPDVVFPWRRTSWEQTGS